MKIGERLAHIQAVRQFFGLPSSAGESAFVDYSGSPDPRTYSLYTRYTGIVWRCVNLIGRATAGAQWDMTKPTASNDPMRNVVKDHEFLQLLNRPHKDFSRYDLLFGSVAFKLMAGEWFWYFAKGSQSGKPLEIHLLHPKLVTVVIDKTTREVVGYKYQVAAGKQIPLDVDEVWHHHTFNPNNPYRGLGTLQASLTYVDTELMSGSFTKNFFKNNGTPSGIVYVDTRGKDEFKLFKRKWKEEYGGVDNAGKLAFIRGNEVKFTKLSIGLGEIDMKALRDMSKEDVAMMFGVPMPLLAKSDQSGLGRNNIEALEYVFAKYTVDDELDELDQSFQKIIDRYWPSDNIEIKHKNVVPADAEHQLKEEEAGVDKWYTRNEIRARRGLAPRKGGDVLYHGTTQMEIPDSDTEAKKSVASKRVVRLSIGSGHKKRADDQAERNERFRTELMLLQENYERSVISEIGKLLDDQKSRVLDIVAPKKSFDAVFSVDEEQAAMKGRVTPLIIDLAAESGKAALLFAGVEDLDFELNKALQDTISESVARMAKNYNADTLQELAASLSEGVANGESLAKLKKRVEQIYEKAKGYRAERVARYETLKGSNGATEQAYRQSGYVKAKEWFTNPGACEYCRAMNGKTINLGGSFFNIGETVKGEDGGEYAINYDTVFYPPLHANCRCTIVPVVD